MHISIYIDIYTYICLCIYIFTFCVIPKYYREQRNGNVFMFFIATQYREQRNSETSDSMSDVLDPSMFIFLYDSITLQGTATWQHVEVVGSKTIQRTAKQRNQRVHVRCPRSVKDRGHLIGAGLILLFRCSLYCFGTKNIDMAPFRCSL